MSWDTIQQLVRIVMQIGAGFLVNQGLITEDMSTTLVGSLVSIAGIAWWALWERTRPADTPAPIVKP
jgi:hypothetical protein